MKQVQRFFGRTGASAVANFLSPYSGGTYLADAQRHADAMGRHPQSFPDPHGSPVMGMGFAAAGVAFHANNFRLLMDANRCAQKSNHHHQQQ